MAATKAPEGVGKAAQKASPTVLKTKPRLDSITSRRISSWRERAARMASGSFSQSFVEPSMSVNRKVTVPVGGSNITRSLLSLRGTLYNARKGGRTSSGRARFANGLVVVRIEEQISTSRRMWLHGPFPRLYLLLPAPRPVSRAPMQLGCRSLLIRRDVANEHVPL